ncbi:aryl hydrocarbon receptor nuclear translocator-like protein 2 isoform X3 [Myripristis murdjan]|uniref:Basic helix-loop-helix ARNT like 2 n=1 Tax=Myripristis murdjan TaxID=586833 RepID=A0A667ZRJ6_9TELE|nr:aryl hydrocarbon receptor nuclear translocator-like protein 2 isoform X3 [Myripristis murdjan]
MSARTAAAGGDDRATGEPAEDVLVEESQSHSVSLPSLMSPTSAAGMSVSMEMPRKRKGSIDNQETKSASIVDADMEDDQDRSEGEDQHVKIKCFREPHSQIEKRRRDKMNNLIDKLSAMIPTCNPMSRKLDKLTVLRMAVQHLKSLKGSTSSFSEANYKPSFLPDEELKHLVLKAELIGQSLFDYIHPKDMGKVMEQLSASEPYPRERLIDAKTGLQVQADLPVGAARLCSGARRSFFCRMKYNKISVKVEEKEFQASTSKKKESQKYCTVHCTGYMRSWPTSQLGAEGEADTDKDSSHFSCLVAVGRVHSHTSPQVNGEVRVKPTEFITRYAMDGKFTFVDQRATTILGYVPQELLGTSCYEYFHQDDLPHLADRHRKVLRSKEKIETNCYKFKTKYGSFVTLQSQWFSFVNPWTKEVEYIVSTNTVISHDHSRTSRSGSKSDQPSNSKTSEEDGKKSLAAIPGIPSTPGTMIYAGSIGTQIANELLDYNRMNSSPSSGNVSPFSLLQDKSPQAHNQASSNVPNGEATDMEVPGKSSSEDEPQGAPFSGGETLMGDNPQLDLESVVGPGLSSLSNDEAAMAVIMSLLETDTNLGEAVDFEEIHWSL